MAVIQNPIIGRAKQKLANAVFSTWKGKNTLRSKPLSVSNPKSEGQTTQRTEFANTVLVARQLLAALKIGFKKVAVGMSEYNYFISRNIKSFNTGAGDVITSPEDIILSKGNLTKENVTQTVVNEGQISMQWITSQGNPTDKCNYAAINKVTGEVNTGKIERTRLSNNVVVNLPNGGAGENNIYLFFSNEAGEVSDTCKDIQ
jgi:hypothetical protein